MIYSRSCEYAIQALVYLAKHPPGHLSLAREIAERQNIPAPFLAKVLQSLSKAGLVESYKGPTGGFSLAVPAREITLRKVLDVIDGRMALNKCLIGSAECSDSRLCPVHESWKGVKEKLEEFLTRTTVQDLVEALKAKEVSLRQVA